MDGIRRQSGIAKDGSFAGVGKGAEPLWSASAGLTDQNSPLALAAGFDPAGAQGGKEGFVATCGVGTVLGSSCTSLYTPALRSVPSGMPSATSLFPDTSTVIPAQAGIQNKVYGPASSSVHDSLSYGISSTTRILRTLPHWVCIFLLTFPPPIHAQIVADQNAHHAYQPHILSAGQNVPVVNIQTPNGAGVSLNHYSQFDVTSQGAILNNARVDVNTERAGHVKGNHSLAGGTASLILNQVNSPHASQLNGFLEVAGDRASVVVANPSGITCDGCGFINTPHATLTTGKPILSGSGALEGYRVEGGTVTFQGNGLNAKNTDYTDVLARAITVNAQVQAGKELRLVAGRNAITQKGTGTPTPTPLEGRSDKPVFALDVAALGGMYAGLIHMVGTEAGVGVNINGILSAESGDVALDVHGPVTVSGTIQGAQNVRVKAKGDVHASGTLLGQAGDVHVDAEGNLTIGGHVDAKNTLALKGKNVTAHKGSRLTAREGHLQLVAKEALTLKGTAKARHTLSTEGSSLDLSGSTLEAQDLSTIARLDDLKLSGSTITSGGRFEVKTQKALITDGATISAQKLEISALSLSNVGGKLTHSGSELFAFKGLSFLDNTQGKIETKGVSFTLEVGRLINTDGVLSHEGQGLMSIKATEDMMSTHGEISSNSDLRMEAAHVHNEGGLISGVKSLWIKAKSLLNINTSENEKGLSSKGTMTIALEEELNNARGLIRTGGDFTLTSGLLTNTDGILSSHSRLNITAYGITAHRGRFASLGAMTINTQGQSFDLTGGSIIAGTFDPITGEVIEGHDLEITSGDLTTDKAKIVGSKKVVLKTAQLSNRDGLITAKEALGIMASGDVVNTQTEKETPGSGEFRTKGIHSDGGLTLTLTEGGRVDNSRGYMGSVGVFSLMGYGLTNVDGIISGGKTTTIDTKGQHLNNTRGALWSKETLTLKTGLLTNTDGVIATDADLKTTSREINARGGSFTSLGSMTLNTQGQSFDLTGGTLNATGDLEITSGDLTTNRAKVTVHKKATLNVGTLHHQDGLINVTEKLDIIAAGDVINTQTEKETLSQGELPTKGISSGGPLLVKAGGTVDNSRGYMMSFNSFTLRSHGLTNVDGVIKGETTATIDTHGHHLDNTRGHLWARQALNITSGLMTNISGVTTTDGTLAITSGAIKGERGTFESLGSLTINTQGQSFDLTAGLVNSSRDLTIISGDLTADEGKIRGGQKVKLTTRKLSNREGLIDAQDSLEIDTQGQHLDNTRGKLWSKEDLTLTTGLLTNTDGTVTTDAGLKITSGEITAHRGRFTSLGATAINTQGHSFDVTGGSVSAGKFDPITGEVMEGHDLEITSGDLTTDRAKIVSSKKSILKVGKLSNQEGAIRAKDSLEIDTQGHHLDNTRGTLWSKETLTLKTGLLTNTDGVIATTARLKITSGEIKAHGGSFASLGTMSINTQGHSFDLTGGTLEVGLFDPITGEIREGHDLEITSGDLTTDKAKIVGSKKATLNVGTLRNHDGMISAKEALDITASGDVINSQTVKETPGAKQPRTKGLRSDGALTLTLTKGGNVDNTRGAMSSGGAFTITDAGLITNHEGRIFAKGSASFTSSGLNNTRGSVSGESLSVKTGAGTLTNRDGVLTARDGPLTLSGKAILNDDGFIYGKGDVTLTALEKISNTNSGAEKGIRSDGNLTLEAGTEIDNTQGRVASARSLKAKGPQSTLQIRSNGGSFVSENEEVSLEGRSLSLEGGTVFAPKKATLSFADSIDASTGKIHSYDHVDITTKTLKVNATKNPQITQETPPDKGIMGRSVHIKADDVDNTQGFIGANADLQLHISKKLTNINGRLEGTKVEIKDRDGASRDLVVENTGGSVFALERLDVEAATLAGFGELTSQGAMNVDLLGNYTYIGGWTVKGALTFSLTGGLTNLNVLKSDGKFTLNTASIDNQTTGELIGRGGLEVHTGTFTNRGLVNGADGVIKASTLTNIGTGRIYGDRLAIQAATLTNTTENGRSGSIATRGDLHLGVGTLTNEKGALIKSLGSLSIGGSLDGNNVAQGKASSVENVSARMEAVGDLTVRSQYLLNKNDGLRHELEMEETFGPKEHLWQDEGWCQFGDRCEHSTYRREEKAVITASDPALMSAGQRVILDVDRGENYASQIVGGQGVFHQGVELKNTTLQVKVRQWDGMRTYGRGEHETWDWHYAMVDYGHKERWTERPYAPTLTEKTVDVLPSTVRLNSTTFSIPGLGEAGAKGGVAFDPRSVSAPVVPSLHTAALLEMEAEPVTHIPLDRAEARDVAWTFLTNVYGPQGVRPAESITQLEPPSRGGVEPVFVGREFGIAKDVSFAGVEGRSPSEALAGLTDQNSPLAMGAGFDPAGAGTEVLLGSGDGNTFGRKVDFAAADILDVSRPVGEKYLIRTVPFSPDIPMASLFTPRPEPTAMYLVETDPAFTDRKTWLSSDVQLKHMGVDPATAQKRVGDGFYEQMLVRDQLIKLTGYRYFAGYEDDLTQYAALLASGAVFGKRYGLIPGVALTPGQMQRLTSPIVWMVKHPVYLNGSAHEVLVPRVYAVVRPGALRGDGALISGRQVKMAMSGTLLNEGGTIAGQERTEIDSKTLANLMGRVGDGGLTKLATQEDLLNIGGSIRGGSVAMDVGRDFASITTTRTNTSQSGSGDNVSRSSTTNIDRVASVTATDGDGTLSMRTGRDTLLKGSVVENQGTGETAITTGRHLTADTVQTRQERETHFHTEKKSWLGTTSSSGSTHRVETQSHGTQISGAGDVTLGAGFGIAKDGSFAGVEGRSPSEALAGLTDQNSPLAWGAGFDPAGAGAPSSSSSPPGNMTFKNATITSGGKTTIMSTGTTTFVDDTETTFSQTMSSDVGLLWQKQKDTGVHKEKPQSTTVSAAGGSSLGTVVTESTPPTDKTWNNSKGSLTPAGAMLVGLLTTALTSGAGASFAGALTPALGSVGSAAVSAGTNSLFVQGAVNLVNNKGDIGQALREMSLKQIGTSMVTAGLTQGATSLFRSPILNRLDQTFASGPGGALQNGITQSGSMTGTAFLQRLPAHFAQSLTSTAANAVLADGDPKAIGQAALGGLANAIGTEASLHLGAAYHNNVLNPVVHKLGHAAVGCGTGALAGGSCAAGAAGAVAAELAGEAFVNYKLSQGSITQSQVPGLMAQGTNISRLIGGMAGFLAGGDPATGANTAGIAVQNNAFLPLLAAPAAFEATIAGLGMAGRACMTNAMCATAVRNAAAHLVPEIVAKFQSESGNAKVQPVEQANKNSPRQAPPPPEPENDGQNGNQKQKGTSAEVLKGKTVLGHYPEYKELADNSNARRFNIPEDAWNKMSDTQRWEANRKFLDRMVARGDDVQLATPLDKVRPGSYFARELEYLAQKGYRPSIDGTRLIK